MEGADKLTKLGIATPQSWSGIVSIMVSEILLQPFPKEVEKKSSHRIFACVLSSAERTLLIKLGVADRPDNNKKNNLTDVFNVKNANWSEY